MRIADRKACHSDAAPATVNEVEGLHPATVRRHGKAQTRVLSPREPGDRPGAITIDLARGEGSVRWQVRKPAVAVPFSRSIIPFASRG